MNGCLGILVLGPPPALVRLLAEAARTVPVVDGSMPGAADAFIWWRDPVLPREGAPWAAWAGTAVDVEAVVDRHPHAILTSDDGAWLRAGDLGVWGVRVPPTSPHERARPVLPFTRARIRRARGLPAAAIGSHDAKGWALAGEPMPEVAADFVCGVSSVLVASDPPSVLRGLAWGCPVVTSPETARSLALEPGIDALVAASNDECAAQAAAIARDDTRAARLSFRARARYESGSSLGSCAVALVDRLGLLDSAAPSRRLSKRLDQLGTPHDALARRRAQLALSGLTTVGTPA